MGNTDWECNFYLFYPITLEGRRGTTDEFATIPFHLDLFSAALVELAKSIPVHSYDELLTLVKKRKLRWFGHVSRSSGLSKTILQDTVKGKRKRGRQKKMWEDNVIYISNLKPLILSIISGSGQYGEVSISRHL